MNITTDLIPCFNMTKNVEKIISAIVFLLAIDLWGVHAKLLYQLNPDKIGESASTFSYISMDENTITAMLFSLVFAFVPILVLTTISPKLEQYWLFVIVFAFFDGGAWFIYYNKTAIAHFNSYGAAYYGFFIVFIVSSIGFIRMLVDDINKANEKEEHKRVTIEDVQKVAEEQLNKFEKDVLNNGLTKTIEKRDDHQEFQEILDEELLLITYLEEGLQQSDIASRLNWHPSKVSRTKKKLIENGRLKTD